MYQKTDAIVGVFNSHLDLVEALKEFKRNDFPMGHVGVVGKGEAIGDIDSVHTWQETVDKGAFIGSSVGLLAGIGMVTIPGLGLIYLGGIFLAPIIGGLSGATMGALGGTLVGTLLGAQYGTEGKIEGHEDYYEDTKKYKEYIEQGKFLLLVHGPKTEVEKAQMILKEHSGNIVLHNHIAIM
jgi:hypothetical protein